MRQVGFRFDQEDADAARSYGCLLEFKHDRFWSSAFITDPAFIADRVRLQLDQLEKQAKRAPARSRTAAAARPAPQRGRRREGAAAPGAPAASRGQGGRDRRELRARPQAAAPLRRTQDHHAGREAARAADPRPRRGQARRARPALRRARTGRSSRPKEVRGKTVEKTRYPEGDEAAEQLYASIERARTPEQVIGRLLQALIAAHAADEEALAASARVY